MPKKLRLDRLIEDIGNTQPFTNKEDEIHFLNENISSIATDLQEYRDQHKQPDLVPNIILEIAEVTCKALTQGHEDVGACLHALLQLTMEIDLHSTHIFKTYEPAILTALNSYKEGYEETGNKSFNFVASEVGWNGQNITKNGL